MCQSDNAIMDNTYVKLVNKQNFFFFSLPHLKGCKGYVKELGSKQKFFCHSM